MTFDHIFSKNSNGKIDDAKKEKKIDIICIGLLKKKL